MRRVLGLSRVVALALIPALSAAAEPRKGFEGNWSTTFGDMTLSSSSGAVRGTYLMGEAVCQIEGRRQGDTLVFSYVEPDASGEGVFRLAADEQSFEGQWRPRGQAGWNPWKGVRPRASARTVSFDGLWETNFGRMRLIEEQGKVSGAYAYTSGATLEGTASGGHLRFRYKEPKAAGEGSFELAPDGRSFRGRWRPDGSQTWGDWQGSRVDSVAGRKWLVIVEARWEGSLADREYSFGEMLTAFFKRTPQVQVRHRFFTDEASLTRSLREASFLAEPTVLLISSHGLAEGVSVGGDVVGPAPIADALRFARNLQLLHVDTCLAMSGSFPKDLLRRLGRAAAFPISGYAETVDWAASAVSDFMYLDLILSRDYAPAEAARALPRLLPYAAVSPSGPKAPFGTVGFRFVEPEL